ncbi:MAG: hypothetical protein HY739_02660 [Desulfobacterales bacterium]|nr:hypothetical protein [Desulfobacterales bacterium]
MTSYYCSDSAINLPSNKVIIGEIQGFSIGSMLRITDWQWSSSPKEPPLKALTEPDVKLSLHPALIIQPDTHTRLYAS